MPLQHLPDDTPSNCLKVVLVGATLPLAAVVACADGRRASHGLTVRTAQPASLSAGEDAHRASDRRSGSPTARVSADSSGGAPGAGTRTRDLGGLSMFVILPESMCTGRRLWKSCATME